MAYRLFLCIGALCLSFGAGAQVQVYRTADGSDNNLMNPDWGQTGTLLLRENGNAYYADGLGAMRVGPNVRSISNAVGTQTARQDYNARGLSSMFWQWGQFIDHDIDLTLESHDEPFSIIVPEGDLYFTPGSTIPFARSQYTNGTVETGQREYGNSITHYLDGSMVYGSDGSRANALRAFNGGRLSVGTDGYMRRNTDGLANANGGSLADNELFLAGDVRANEQVSLTAMHETFFRLHNKWADRLSADNTTWTDDEVYQTARKIVGAQVQKITYEEWLPSMLGTNGLSSYGGYDDTVDASISATFSTAAFRFGHTMLNEQLKRYNADGSEFADGHLNLRESFFNPNVITATGSLDAVMRGLVYQHANELDTQVVEDVRSFLFGDPDFGGLDLLALNLQRGRDHGIATYNQVRMDYGLSEVTSFSDLTDDVDLAMALCDVYEGDIDSVDAWIGLMSEEHLDDSVVGETLARIMVDQFSRLRDGDRFYYENDDELLPYLDEIEGTDLGDVLAWTTGVDEFTGDVFFAGGGLQLIPEPASLVLIGIGMLAITGRRRRQRV